MLEVVAIDGGVGSERLTGWSRVMVNITDVNNKPPRFVKTAPVVISENVTVGHAIAHLEANDPDANAVLRFTVDNEKSEARNGEGRVVELSDYDWSSMFTVNQNTGDVLVSDRLDREMIQEFELEVVVEDISAASGTDRQIATTSVHITVMDVNDNNPVFSKSEYNGHVTENSGIGTKIMRVLATDADANRTIKYSISGGKHIRKLLIMSVQTIVFI